VAPLFLAVEQLRFVTRYEETVPAELPALYHALAGLAFQQAAVRDPSTSSG